MSKLAHIFFAYNIYKHVIFAVLKRLIQMQIDYEQIFSIIFAVFIG